MQSLTSASEIHSGSVVVQELNYYAVNGNRVEQDVSTGGTTTVTHFAYDLAGNVVADLNSSNAVISRRLFLDATDSVFARIASGGTLDFYLSDHLGSIRGLENTSGTLDDAISYDAWGNIASESSPTNGDRYKFTGREWDSNVGTQYNRARYYDPVVGRWVSQDPLAFGAGDSNLFRYTTNTPTHEPDPSGLDPVLEFPWRAKVELDPGFSATKQAEIVAALQQALNDIEAASMLLNNDRLFNIISQQHPNPLQGGYYANLFNNRSLWLNRFKQVGNWAKQGRRVGGANNIAGPSQYKGTNTFRFVKSPVFSQKNQSILFTDLNNKRARIKVTEFFFQVGVNQSFQMRHELARYILGIDAIGTLHDDQDLWDGILNRLVSDPFGDLSTLKKMFPAPPPPAPGETPWYDRYAKPRSGVSPGESFRPPATPPGGGLPCRVNGNPGLRLARIRSTHSLDRWLRTG